MLVSQMILASILGSVAYTIIGVIPGADETAVLAPVTLAIVLSGVHPAVVLAFFMAAIISKKISDAIPVSVAGIPSGVMSTPLIEHAQVLKENGLADKSIKISVSGSFIGTLVAVPFSLLLAGVLIPFSEIISAYTDQIFLGGAIFLALMAKNKLISLISIIPFALIIQGLRHLYWGTGAIPEDETVFISFFLGITIGPMIVSLLELTMKERREHLLKDSYKETIIRNEKHEGIPNPFKILNRKEIVYAALGSVIGCVTFFLSPVGATVFIGETLTSRIEGVIEKAKAALATVSSITNASYIAGTLIPLVALGVPLSPMALGPANPLFNAPPVLTIENNIHHMLDNGEFYLPILIGTVVALVITVPVTIKYANKICAFVFKRLSHESLLGLFFGLVVMLSFMEAGVINIFGVLALSIVSGILNRWGVNYGVQFMILYAAPWLATLLAF